MTSKKIALFLLLIFISNCKSLIAQSDFYDIDSIHEIKIYFSQSNWDEILDSLYVEGENARLAGDVEIDGEFYKYVGIRYKGFSSYSSTRIKNPFNIDLNYTIDDQNHRGYTKIKLSNVIQDPSFVRESLSYEIARKYMPAPKANYANVYVNDTLIGLYTNVEAINEKFVSEHFGVGDNTLVKCNPESLDLNGENSNLSNSHGSNIENYTPYYKMQSEERAGWDDLYELIDSLNQPSSEIEAVLNIDRTLWMHAFNYSVINFDSYVGYAQNYYVYKDLHGRFNPLLWDLNMSFGSFRLTDASDNWDGFSIAEAKTIDPLQHINSVSVQPRPLIRNLLVNDTYKRMYMAHIRTINEENFLNLDYYNRAQEIQTTVNSSVVNDTNKFYSYSDFTINIDTTVSDLVDYPGIKDLMNARSAYLTTVVGYQNAPDISEVSSYPTSLVAGDSVWITAKIEGTVNNASLYYRLSESELFKSIPMEDNGLFNDGNAGDSIYGAVLTNISNKIQYYIYAENDTAGMFAPKRAAYEFYELYPEIRFNDIVVNEMMINNSVVADQEGEFDDWIELYNNADYTISTANFYLSDSEDTLLKWELPETDVLPGQYVIVWLDEDSLQSGFHCNCTLDNGGNKLWMSNSDGTFLDSLDIVKYDGVTSYGRYPNGIGSFIEMQPSFASKNTSLSTELLEDDVFVYPNPARDVINIRVNNSKEFDLSIYGTHGRLIYETSSIEGNRFIQLNTSAYASGIYFFIFNYDEQSLTKKVIINH